MNVYEAALTATSTAHGPWRVIPANSKLVRKLLLDALKKLKMRYPESLEGAADAVIV